MNDSQIGTRLSSPWMNWGSQAAAQSCKNLQVATVGLAKLTGITDVYDAFGSVQEGQFMQAGKRALSGAAKLAVSAGLVYGAYQTCVQGSRYFNYLQQPDSETIAQFESEYFSKFAHDGVGGDDLTEYFQWQMDHNYIREPSEEALRDVYGHWQPILDLGGGTRELYHETHDKGAEMAYKAYDKGLLWSMKDTARYAHGLRASSRNFCRWKQWFGGGKVMGFRDLHVYGKFNGPTFEDMIRRKGGDFAAIIDSARKSNASYDAVLLVNK